MKLCIAKLGWQFLLADPSCRRIFFEDFLPDRLSADEIFEAALKGFNNDPYIEDLLREFIEEWQPEAFGYWLQHRKGARSYAYL